MVTIKVVCGIIYDSNKILICRRNPSKSLGGFWEFPGGKIEQDESDEYALKRELNEELQMQVNITEYFGSSIYDYESFSVELIAYECNLKKWNLYLTDHDLYKWIHPVEILNYKLSPADIPLAQKIKIKIL
jgi:8-oxo-dGTP diphosphatase